MDESMQSCIAAVMAMVTAVAEARIAEMPYATIAEDEAHLRHVLAAYGIDTYHLRLFLSTVGETRRHKVTTHRTALNVHDFDIQALDSIDEKTKKLTATVQRLALEAIYIAESNAACIAHSLKNRYHKLLTLVSDKLKDDSIRAETVAAFVNGNVDAYTKIAYECPSEDGEVETREDDASS